MRREAPCASSVIQTDPEKSDDGNSSGQAANGDRRSGTQTWIAIIEDDRLWVLTRQSTASDAMSRSRTDCFMLPKSRQLLSRSAMGLPALAANNEPDGIAKPAGLSV